MDDMNNLNQNPQQMPTYSQPEVEPVMTIGEWALTKQEKESSIRFCTDGAFYV